MGACPTNSCKVVRVTGNVENTFVAHVHASRRWVLPRVHKNMHSWSCAMHVSSSELLEYTKGVLCTASWRYTTPPCRVTPRHSLTKFHEGLHLSKTLPTFVEDTATSSWADPTHINFTRTLANFFQYSVRNALTTAPSPSETRGKPFSIGPRKPSFDFVWPCKSTSCERKCASDVNGIGPSIDVWYFCKVPIAADDLLQTDFDRCMCSDRNVRQCEVDCRST